MAQATLLNRTSQPSGLGGTPPKGEGARALGVLFDFTLGTTLPFNVQFTDVGMSMVQGLFVDNRNNNSSASFQLVGSNQFIVCPPLTQGYFPALIVGGQSLTMIGTSAGNVQVIVQLLNTPVQAALWNATNPTVTGTVTVNGTVSTQPLTATYTNRSGSIASAGASQLLCSSNGSRKRLFVQNPFTASGQNIGAAESLFINFSLSSAVNDGVSIELLAGASFDTGQGPVTTEAVTVTAATAGHRYISREM